MTNVLYTRGTAQNLLTTGLNALANNANAVGTSVTLTSAGFTQCELELQVTFTSVLPAANTAISVWFLREIDGTNFEDGSASITPARAPDAYLPVRSTTLAQRIIMTCDAPTGPFKPLLRNDGTGTAFDATGNVLAIRPFTESI